MKANEYEMLVQAGVVTSVVLMKRGDDEWEVWCYGKRLPASTKNPIETARGTRRTWSSLDTAYGFIRSAGGRVKVSLDELGAGEIVAPGASDESTDDMAPRG